MNLSVDFFHLLASIFISFIGGSLLLAIWYHIQKQFKTKLIEDEQQPRLDKGLFYLALAMFVWVVSGVWNLIYINFSSLDAQNFTAGLSIFSALNNICFFFALFYFRHAPKYLFQKSKIRTTISFTILGLAFITIISTFIFGDDFYIFNSLKLNAIPDFLISILITYWLMLTFYKTFTQRNLKLIGIIAFLALLMMLVSQLPDVIKLPESIFTFHLIKIIAKTSLISICLVLATSWVIELAQTPTSKEVTLHFIDWSLVKITIPSKDIYDELIDFGSKTTQFKNFLLFAISRQNQNASKQGILVGSDGKIKSQTYLSRIIENINSILNLEKNNALERKDLFTFLGEGTYRLRVLPEHIKIDEALKNEFQKK
ncbi:hypothetical protein [Aureivirga sp. CE67]|uniref:hypothetical protein n=1 Tax=Aureivirga sp. CE67 TaxID=1788983 RepID=UPI0018CBE5D7|nr:hypothetical protein [Aureivirga sp. CE67]